MPAFIPLRLNSNFLTIIAIRVLPCMLLRDPTCVLVHGGIVKTPNHLTRATIPAGTANRRMNNIETPLSTDTEKAIESARINGVSVLSGFNLEKFPTPETIRGMGTSFRCNDFWDGWTCVTFDWWMVSMATINRL